MDEINWTAINFNILLNGCLLSIFSVAGELSIKESESQSHSIKAEELNNWPVNVEHHGTD